MRRRGRSSQTWPSPFEPTPRAPGKKKNKKNGDDGDDDPTEAAVHAPEPGPHVETPLDGEELHAEGVQGEPAVDGAAGEPAQDESPQDEEEERIQIDLEGIADRILAFPVEDARYEQIRGIEGKVLFSWWPIEGTLHSRRPPGSTPPASGVLDVYDFGDQKVDTLIDGLSSFEVSMDAKTLIYRMGNKLRVLRAGDKPDNKGGSAPSRQSGWLDLNRLKVSVSPGAEWA